MNYDQPFIIEAKRIYSLSNKNQTFQAMIIENGRIKELFTDIPSVPLPKISFANHYLIPGFIDSHTHILLMGLQKIFPDLHSAISISEALEILRNHLFLAKEYGFIFGYNLDPENLKEKRYPFLNELDKLTTNYPVIVFRVDAHSAVLNTKAREEINALLKETKEFVDETGIVRGGIFEFCTKVFYQKLPRELKVRAFEEAANEAVCQGVTTLVTMLGSDDDHTSCGILLEILNSLPIEVVPFYQTRNTKIVRELNLPRIGGCILIDGSFGSHTAALFTEYKDCPGTSGVLYLSDKELERFFSQAEEAGLQTAVHAIGDRAIDQVLRIWEKLIKTNYLRHRIEHCELLNDELILRIKNLGLIVSAQPAFEFFWGGAHRMYAQRLGNDWQRTNPLSKLLLEDIVVLGGSDAPITPINPLLGIKSAVLHPNHFYRVNNFDALKMFTINGAYGIFAENRIGLLLPNYEANFVVLESDPISTIDNKIKAVFYRGRCLFASD
jgi:predicted amidohydrolase YtcJ